MNRAEFIGKSIINYSKRSPFSIKQILNIAEMVATFSAERNIDHASVMRMLGKGGRDWRNGIYSKASQYWGPDCQKIVAIEEFSELINELTKQLNGKNKRGIDGIIDEVADCRIMLEQLEGIFLIESDVEIRIIKKLMKLDEILRGEIDHAHKGNN